MSETTEAPTTEAEAAEVAEQPVPKRVLVIVTTGANVQVQTNTMSLLEAKASLEMVHTAVCAQINQPQAQQAVAEEPAKEPSD